MHICRKFVNVTIQAIYPESFCMSFAVRKVLVFSDSGCDYWRCSRNLGQMLDKACQHGASLSSYGMAKW